MQNYLLLPVFLLRPEKYNFLNSESIRGKERDLVEPNNALLSAFLPQWHDLAAWTLKILLKIVWTLALQSVKRLIDHRKWKKNVNSALNIIVSLHLSASAAEEAKLKTIVSRSGFYKKKRAPGWYFCAKYFPLLEAVISKS